MTPEQLRQHKKQDEIVRLAKKKTIAKASAADLFIAAIILVIAWYFIG